LHVQENFKIPFIFLDSLFIFLKMNFQLFYIVIVIMKESGIYTIITRIIIFIACILLLLVGVNLIVSSKAENYLHSELEKIIETNSKGLYRMKIGKVDVDFLSGSARVNDIRVQLNYEKFNLLEELDGLPEIYGSAKITSISLLGLDYTKLLLSGKRKFKLKELRILNPEFYVFHEEHTDTMKKKREAFDFYSVIAPYLDEVNVKKISTSGGKFICSEQKNTQEAPFEINIYGLGFDVKNWIVNSERNTRGHVFYSDDVILKFDSIATLDPKNLYTYSVGEGKIGIRDSYVCFNHLGLTSTVPKWEYAHKHPTHADWFDVKIGEIQLMNVDFNKLIDEKTLIADSLFITKVDLQNLKNTTIPISHNIMPMVYEQVHNIPLDYAINYVNLSGVEVIYEEYPENGNGAGKIFFTDLQGIYPQGLTNIVSFHEQTNHLVAYGKLMGVGEVHAEMEFPVDSTYDHVIMQGKLGTMSMLALNPILEPLTSAKLEEGFIQGMDFYVEGGRKEAYIDMTLRYNDLSIAFLRGKKDHHTKKGILSFLAKGLVEKDNPAKGENVRRAKAVHIRDPYHSSFNYLWKILSEGLIRSLGLTDHVLGTIEWFKNEK